MATLIEFPQQSQTDDKTENVLQRATGRALTVLGELEELSRSSGESSSSSGSVGMVGSSGGRERVWGKIKGSSAVQGASQDSLDLGALCSRGDPCSKCSSSSWGCKITHEDANTCVCYT